MLYVIQKHVFFFKQPRNEIPMYDTYYFIV